MTNFLKYVTALGTLPRSFSTRVFQQFRGQPRPQTCKPGKMQPRLLQDAAEITPSYRTTLCITHTKRDGFGRVNSKFQVNAQNVQSPVRNTSADPNLNPQPSKLSKNGTTKTYSKCNIFMPFNGVIKKHNMFNSHSQTTGTSQLAP